MLRNYLFLSYFADMKTLFKLCFLAIIPFTSFANPLSSGLLSPDNVYLKLKGKIADKYAITMDIIKRRDTIAKTINMSGSYYYDNVGMPLEVYGKLDNIGNFELTERDSKGDVTGTFKGSFTGNTMKGVWINPKTKKELSFELSEAIQNIAQFDLKDYYHENCERRKINLKSHKKDTLNWVDTLCSDMSISIITVKNLKPNACKKINTLLEKSLLQTSTAEKPYKTVNDLLYSIDGQTDFDFSDEQYTMNVTSNEENVLCIELCYYGNTGGAHPNSYCSLFNFNPQTGDTISLKEILLPEAYDNLWGFAKEKFIKTNGDLKDIGWFDGEGEFRLANNFAITKGGILFQYNTYEAGPYAMGAPQVFMTKKELEGLVKPEYLK